MLAPGIPAPSFDCSAVVDLEIVEFLWDKLHGRQTLVLQFDSIENYSASPQGLVTLSNSIGEFQRLQANVAVVCRDQVFEILEWANRSADEGGQGEIAFPFLVDSDDRIASRYDMLDAEGCSLWGHILIDPVGKIRQLARSSFHVDPNIDELIRCVTSINNEQS
jgi:alkyl hydroperoxide reductase subunit AhpC